MRSTLRGVAQLGSALERIRVASGLVAGSSAPSGGGVYEVADAFLATEDKNFRLFNFVNGLNGEVERLELMLVATKGEIEQFKGQGLSADAERKKVLNELAEKLQRGNAQAEEYEAETKTTAAAISTLKTGIQAVFTKLGPMRDTDGGPNTDAEVLGSQGVTEMNMNQYLGVIEQRASEILQQHCESQKPGVPMGVVELMANLHARPEEEEEELEGGEGAQKGGGGGPVSPGGTGLSIKPPAMDDLSDHGDDSDNEDDERPLTRGEVHKRTIKGLSGVHSKHHKGRERR